MAEITRNDPRLPSSNSLLDQTVLRVDTPAERAVLGLLALSHRHQLDPVPLLQDLAADCSSEAANEISSLSNYLANGSSVPEALRLHPALIRPENAIALELASRAGNLSAVYRELSASDELAGEPIGDRAVGTGLSTLLWQLLFCLMLISFLMIFIVPTFQEMFDEFEMKLPTPTLVLIAISEKSAQTFLSPLLLIVLAVVLAFWARRLWVYLQVLSTHGLDILQLRKPPMPDSARMLPLLAIAVEANQLPGAITMLAGHHASSHIRRRLSLAATSIDAGVPPFHALQTSGLLSKKNVQALSGSEEPSTQAWLLRFMAARQQSNSSLRLSIVKRVLSVLMLTCLIAVVALAAIGLFIPLVALISALS
ncbi:MAG: type II secretion system F family protein [Planctomycetota bacterium]